MYLLVLHSAYCVLDHIGDAAAGKQAPDVDVALRYQHGCGVTVIKGLGLGKQPPDVDVALRYHHGCGIRVGVIFYQISLKYFTTFLNQSLNLDLFYI